MRLPGSEAALAAAERQVFLMKRIYLTVEDHLNEINTFEKGCWVHLQNPTREEIDGINARFALDPTYIQSALDEEESARIERDGDQTLIIVDIPYVEAEGNGYSYTTVPLGIIMVDDVIITVSTRESTIITDFTEERIRGFWTFKRTRFILQLLHRNASRFLAYLKQIDKASMFVQTRLDEGERLGRDLTAKLDYMLTLVDFIEERAPVLLREYRQKLEDKVSELLASAAVDESRIAAEVTIYADKICVDEEMVRLRSHIVSTREKLAAGGTVGRELDFIAQEMNREANTTLSKSNDLEISDRAIALKTEIEKVREQIQNIE